MLNGGTVAANGTFTLDNAGANQRQIYAVKQRRRSRRHGGQTP